MSDYQLTRDAAATITTRYEKMLRNLSDDYYDLHVLQTRKRRRIIMDDICPSCREPLDCPSGDGCSEDPLLNLTLDTDELGIWLVEDIPEGPLQLGHVSWKVVAQGVQTALLQERFLLALTRLDEEDGLFDAE